VDEPIEVNNLVISGDGNLSITGSLLWVNQKSSIFSSYALQNSGSISTSAEITIQNMPIASVFSTKKHSLL